MLLTPLSKRLMILLTMHLLQYSRRNGREYSRVCIDCFKEENMFIELKERPIPGAFPTESDYRKFYDVQSGFTLSVFEYGDGEIKGFSFMMDEQMLYAGDGCGYHPDENGIGGIISDDKFLKNYIKNGRLVKIFKDNFNLDPQIKTFVLDKLVNYRNIPSRMYDAKSRSIIDRMRDELND